MKRKEVLMFGALAIIAGLIGGLFSGQLSGRPAVAGDVQERIVARGLMIVDADGKLRITLGLDDNDNGRMIFGGKDGKPRVWLQVEDGTALSFSDSNGNERVRMGITPDESSMGFHLMDQQGGLTASLIQNSAGSELTGLVVYGRDQKTHGMFGTVGGTPMASFWDKYGKAIWSRP